MTSTTSDAVGAAPARVDFYPGCKSLRLAASVYGPADAAPVILLPGAGQTRHAWHRSAIRLAAQGFRAIALDLRGHGDSAWADDGDYSIAAFCGDLEAVLAVQERAVVVGASLGGVASLLVAAGQADRGADRRIAGLVLVDVVPDMRPEGLARIRGFMTSGMDGFASAEEAAAAVARYLPERPAPKSLDGLLRNLREAPDGRWYWHWDPAFHKQSGARAAGDLAATMERAAPRVVAPTLLVTGARSEVVDEDGVRRLLALMPHAEWFSVADARHMVAGDQNDVFGDALCDFVARCLR